MQILSQISHEQAIRAASREKEKSEQEEAEKKKDPNSVEAKKEKKKAEDEIDKLKKATEYLTSVSNIQNQPIFSQLKSLRDIEYKITTIIENTSSKIDFSKLLETFGKSVPFKKEEIPASLERRVLQKSLSSSASEMDERSDRTTLSYGDAHLKFVTQKTIERCETKLEELKDKFKEQPEAVKMLDKLLTELFFIKKTLNDDNSFVMDGATRWNKGVYGTPSYAPSSFNTYQDETRNSGFEQMQAA